MAFERIELNICPAGDMPVFHCSQYDIGRPIIIDLKNGDDAFTPSAGTTFELHCRKVDDNIVTLDTYEVDGNTLTFTSTEQLCACPGDNLCEVAIYLDELCMGTLNFMLHVEPDPLAGGLESETQIYNLTEQVEEITEQVIGDNYYDKTEVDDLLDAKADVATTYTKTEVDTALNLKADKSDTYTKTETNNLLAGKADASDTYTKAQVDSKLSLKADKATTYTKTETDTLLGYKANASQVYTMSQTDLLLADKADKSTTYTKIQVDDALALKANSADLATVATTGDYDDLLNKPDIEGMIADALLEVMPVDTASGPIASFNTALAANYPSVLVNVVATGGNGTPDNPNPINGYSSANITRCGVNLWDEEWLNGYYNPSNGEFVSNANYICSKNLIKVSPSTQYYIHSDNNILIEVLEYRIDGTYIRRLSSGSRNETITTDNDCAYIHIGTHGSGVITTYTSGISINNPATDTTYHAYNGSTVTIAFGQTVYGGVLDVTRGKLTVTWLGKTYTGDATEHWTLHGSGSASAFAMRSSDYINIDINEIPKANYLQGISRNEMWGRYDNWVSVTADKQIVTGIQSITSVTDWTDYLALHPLTVIWKAETPFDIDLTPVQIRALVGENNVYSDTNGNTTVQFKDSIQHYIDTKVGS